MIIFNGLDINYAVFPGAKSRSDAKTECERNNGTLPSFVNQDEINKMLEATRHAGHEYWTGLKYSDSFGNWSFDDNANTTFAMTKFSQPLNLNSARCVIMEGSGTFRKDYCSGSRKVLCQTGQRSPPLLTSGQKCRLKLRGKQFKDLRDESLQDGEN